MFQIFVPAQTLWDENQEEFIHTKEQTLVMEHSLMSIANWEAKWKKPFLDEKTQKTNEELIDYFRCMTITKNVDPQVFGALTKENIQTISDYIKDPYTATTFYNDPNERPSREIMTAEVIYWQMIHFNIPESWEKKNLNRLLTLIKVCARKEAGPKKLNGHEAIKNQRALNKARRAKLHSKG